MAETYRIPLISFCVYEFWSKWLRIQEKFVNKPDTIIEQEIINFTNELGKHMAVAVTNTGQLLFLYNSQNGIHFPEDKYIIQRQAIDKPWRLFCGNEEYLFKLPEIIVNRWIKEEAGIRENMSRMIIYYKKDEEPCIKMLSTWREEILELSKKIVAEESVHKKEDGQKIEI